MATILIVDDDSALRRAISTALAISGTRQRRQPTAKPRWLGCPRHHADAVLLDLRMPGMDGRTSCAASERSQTRPPVAVLTAVPTSDNTIEAMRPGGR